MLGMPARAGRFQPIGAGFAPKRSGKLWTPRRLGGEFCWEDVGALGLPGGAITSLPAQFSNLKPMSRATGAGTVIIGAGSGLAPQVITLTSSSDVRLEADLSSPASNELTLWAVCRYTSQRANVCQIGNPTTTNPIGLVAISYDFGYQSYEWGGEMLNDLSLGTGTAGLNQNIVQIGRFSNNVGFVTQSVNGNQTSTTGALSSRVRDTFALGSGWGDAIFNGDVVAFGMVPRAISDADTLRLEGWAHAKFGIPLPATHRYFRTPPSL